MAWPKPDHKAAARTPRARDAASLQPAPVQPVTRRSGTPHLRTRACMAAAPSFAARPDRSERSSDADLLELVASRDPGALETLYRRYRRSVYSQALGTVRDQDAAAEVLQDVFLQVWRTAGGYRVEKGTASTWLFAVTRHCAVDMLRRLSARTRAERRAADLAPHFESADVFDLTWGDMCRRQLSDDLKTLPAEQLRAVELAYFEGLTHRDIARRLDIPVGTVKGRLRLGLKRLRKRFEDRGMLVL